MIVKGRDHSRNLRINGKIILKWNISNQGEKLRTGFIWVSMKVSGINGNVIPGSIKERVFIDSVVDYYLPEMTFRHSS